MLAAQHNFMAAPAVRRGRLRRGVALVACHLALVGLARAGSATVEPGAGYGAILSSVDPKTILPAPPPADSLAGRADVAVVLAVQAGRTPEQVQWAKRVAASDYFALLTDGILPARISTEACPATFAFFRRLHVACAAVGKRAKDVYIRQRPFGVDPRIEPCVVRLTTGSFPSGHAYEARVLAQIIGELLPEYRTAVLERADRVAWARVVAGVHYPTDLVAGKMLADAVVFRLRADCRFRADLEDCRTEIESVLRDPE